MMRFDWLIIAVPVNVRQFLPLTLESHTQCSAELLYAYQLKLRFYIPEFLFNVAFLCTCLIFNAVLRNHMPAQVNILLIFQMIKHQHETVHKFHLFCESIAVAHLDRLGVLF